MKSVNKNSHTHSEILKHTHRADIALVDGRRTLNLISTLFRGTIQVATQSKFVFRSSHCVHQFHAY